jgi:diketogulonate reductase-like aldo/keto reductase
MNAQSSVTLHTGNRMPVMGLGTWQLTNDTAGTVQAAFGLGYRMIDTAEDYGTQPGIGEAIKRSGIDRSSVYLVAKIEETDDPTRPRANTWLNCNQNTPISCSFTGHHRRAWEKSYGGV